MFRFATTFALIFAVISIASSTLAASKVSSSNFESWLVEQEQSSVARMLANVSPADAARGAVIASPERVAPNYYFHWVRDAALTMDVVVDLYDRSQGSLRDQRRAQLLDYLRFSRRNQLTSTRSGMGEPKFNVDGTAFMGDWCRPQNDGPALRAITLIRLARRLMSEGQLGLVRSEIYDGKIPTESVVKADLEFVAHHWREKSCDIWEEVEGDHLYTRLAQHRALNDGAELAVSLGDGRAAQFYRSQAASLRMEIDAHWDFSRRLLVPTLGRSGGLASKASDIDSQVILGLLHGSGIAIEDARALATLEAQTRVFAKLYSINRRTNIPGVGIGRYPEDVYDGEHFQGGNPWVLSTAAFATAHYLIAGTELDAGNVASTRSHFEKGDSFLRRLQFHSNPDGSLSEQFQRETGYMTSARDLTWSHAEFLRAKWARAEIASRLPFVNKKKGRPSKAAQSS